MSANLIHPRARIVFLVLAGLQCGGGPARADETGPDLFHLSLEQLMAIKVHAATRSDREQDQVPGVVRVVTRQEWQRYGAETLVDVLRRLPGAYPYGNSLLRDGSTDIRGQQAPASDRHLLLLLNGRPVREAFRGAFDRALNVAFPLAALDRIEYIRGAGSAVYGSNAFSGVINLITHSTDPEQRGSQTRLEASLGTDNTQRYLLDSQLSLDAFRLHASLQSRQSDGWPFKATDLDGVYREDPVSDDDQSLFLQAEFGPGFHLQYFGNAFDFEGFGNVPRWPLRTWDGDFAVTNLGWRSSNPERTQWQLNYTDTHFDSTTEASPAIPVTAEFDSVMRTAELEGVSDLTPQLQMAFGVELNSLDNSETDTSLGSGAITTTVSKDSWQRLYGQLDWAASGNLHILAGITANWTDTETAALTPRTGIVYQYGSGWLFKWHYGEAFRSPYLIERFLRSGSFIGNPNLQAETIAQHDLQVQYRSGDWLSSVSLFSAEISDLIAFTPTSDGGLTYGNINRLDSHGGEWEWRWQPAAQWALEASVSYQQNEDGRGVEDTQLVANSQVKVGGHYQFDSGWELALFDNWSSKPISRTELNPATAVRNPAPKAYHHLTVSISVPLARWLSLPDEQLSTRIFIDNAVESDPIYRTDSVRADINSLPYRPGRRIYLQLGSRF